MTDLPRLDKTAVSIGSLHDKGDEWAYWLSKTPEERLEALEIQRRMVYGEDQLAQPLQRVVEIVDRERS